MTVRELSEDTYFLERDYARLVAAQGLQVEAPGGPRLQLCYHDGPPFADAPVNLLSVPLGELAGVFPGSGLPVPRYVHAAAVEDQPARRELEAAFGAMAEQLAACPAPCDTQERDTYFFDLRDAFLTAVQRRRVPLEHPTIDGLQICYYDGPELPGAPENLVRVPCEEVTAFFAQTRLRLPGNVAFPEETDPALKARLLDTFGGLMKEAQAQRDAMAAAVSLACGMLAPGGGERPLRVFLPANRLTQVMQYVSKGLARAFQRLGHQAFVSMERNGMERLDTAIRRREYLEYGPDLVVNINGIDNDYLHPAVHNIIWFQDPMPGIRGGEPLNLRPNDHLFSFSPELDHLLRRCGATHIGRQHFCIDEELFRVLPDARREDKVVFVGSAGDAYLLGNPGEAAVVERLTERMEAGEPPDRPWLDGLAADSGIDARYLYWNLLYQVVRRTTVHWLCRHSPLPVEIYGRYWDADPVVAPFFKGEIPHGAAVAEVYNGARYALVAHPFDLNSQRLAEVAACGCIPLVWDARALAEPPFWEAHVLYFQGGDALRRCLGLRPERPPEEMAGHFTYDRLARRILKLVGAVEAPRQPAFRAVGA